MFHNIKRYLSIIFLISALSIAIGCKDSEKENKVVGLNQTELIRRWGTPLHEKLILLNNKTILLEYQSNLYNLFKDRHEHDTVKVKELIWKNDGKTKAVWFLNEDGKWISIDQLSWDKDVSY